jgi:hypothetical protein
MTTDNGRNEPWKESGNRHERRRRRALERDAQQPATSQKTVRYKSDFKITWAEAVIPLSAVTTGILVGLAAPQLLGGSGILSLIKAGLLGAAAGFVSLVVNHNAVKQGTELAAHGVKTGAIVSLAAVCITGGGAFAFSYSGITISHVEALSYDEHGQELAVLIEDTNAYAAQVTRVQPVIASIARDIETKLECEVTEGCLSGKRGGKGPIYRGVLAPTERARQISVQLEAADKVRADQLALSNKLLGDYQAAQTNDAGLGADEYRKTLAGLDAQIKQQVANLREAAPISLIRAYQLELHNGLSIEGHPEGTRIVNGMLDSHAEAIGVALKDIAETVPESPAFPRRAGVSDAFSRLGHFWPIAILTAAIELIIPLTLWWLAHAALVLKLFREEKAGN